jgi:hypothetical protein
MALKSFSSGSKAAIQGAPARRPEHDHDDCPPEGAKRLASDEVESA